MAKRAENNRAGPQVRKRPPSPQAAARTRRRADGFRTARAQNAAETAEDYVELIDELIRNTGEARSVDLARFLGVSHVTVTKTVRRLHRDKLVRAEPYRSIHLTPAGKRLAAACRKRHELVVSFLQAIGVDQITSEQDAEGIEHHVSDKLLRVMKDFVAKHGGDDLSQ